MCALALVGAALLAAKAGAQQVANRSFCLNFFEPVPLPGSNNTLFYCKCDPPFRGDYCQVNDTLGPIIITSAALSLLACGVQFALCLKFRQFFQWPNYIVYFRSATDFMFSLHLIIFQAIVLTDPNSLACSVSPHDELNFNWTKSEPTCNSGERGPCTYFSLVFQVTLVGSLLWFGCGSYDYWKTISDPFVHPSTYKRTYTIGVIFVSIACAVYGVLGGPGDEVSRTRLYRDGLQACWTATTMGSKVNLTNFYTMYIWLLSSLIVTVVVGAIGYIKMRSGGTQKTLAKRLKAIEGARAQLLAFFFFWFFWGILFALYYFGGTYITPDDKTAFKWTPYIMMGLLPLNGFVNAVVWFYNNHQEIRLAYATDKEGRKQSKQQQRTRGLMEEQERNVARQEEQKSDMSQALKDELLSNITSGMLAVLSKPLESKYEGGQSIIKIISDGRPAKERVEQLTRGLESRIPKLFRCPGVDQARDVEFIEHRPNAFRFLRESCYGVSDEKYLESFKALNAKLLSGGKSGALFFSTPDNKFLVKTLEPGTLFKSSELGVLLEVLDSYCLHMTPRKFRKQSIQRGQRLGCSSLITKIYGCYTIKIYGRTLEFYVMEKLDPESAKVKVTERYDLKGSWVARHSKKAGTGKDQNFMGQTINLAPSLAQDIFMQSVSDVHFFEKNKIMDYSLLLAVHRCRDARVKDKHCTFDKTDHVEVKLHVPESDDKGEANNHSGVVFGGEDPAGHLELDEFVRTPASAVPVHKIFEGGMQSAFMEGPGIYFMGIIDPLQKWDCAKICEGFFKRYIMCKGIGISAVPPPLFATRFLLMMLKNLDVSLASLASLDEEYREAYGIDCVQIINHKVSDKDEEELTYLLQLVRCSEDRELERSASVSLSRKSFDLVGRMNPTEGSLIACESWEAEASIIKDPVGKKMVAAYRQEKNLGAIGENMPRFDAQPSTTQQILQSLATPFAKVVGGLGETLRTGVRSSVGPLSDGDEEGSGLNRAGSGLSRAGSGLSRAASRNDLTGSTYVPPTLPPTSPTHSFQVSDGSQ